MVICAHIISYMNIVFVLICAVSILLLLFENPNLILAAMIEGSSQAIDLMIKLCALYCVWISVLEIMTETRISILFCKAFSPVSKRLFKSETAETQGLVSLCLATNMLGLGSAATPLGIAAMENMAKGRTTASKNMVMFLVINATSIQLLPATIIAMRTEHGSVAPSDIIIPSLIATAITTLVGIILVKIFVREDKNDLNSNIVSGVPPATPTDTPKTQTMFTVPTNTPETQTMSAAPTDTPRNSTTITTSKINLAATNIITPKNAAILPLQHRKAHRGKRRFENRYHSSKL